MGTEYAVNIDRLIIENLPSSVDDTIRYNALYKIVYKARHCSLSHETFNEHLNILQKKGLIGKKSSIGKTAYHLTDKARIQTRLGILELGCKDETFLEPRDSKEQLQLKKYFILLYYGGGLTPFYQLTSKKGYETFLVKNRISEKDLLGGKPMEVNNKLRTGVFRLYIDPSFGTQISIFEGLSRNKEDQPMEHKISYSYRPPGFSIAEIVQDRKRIEFCQVKFDRSTIQELITALEGEGVLEKITVIDNEIRYRVSDYRLHRFLKECWKLYHEVIEALLYLWFDIRNPSPEEKTWLKLVYGNKADDYRKLEQMFAKMFYERA